MICMNFEPVFTPQARVLIVGSMPSVKSLADQQYYAHPRNAFWPILFDVFGEERTDDYEKKKALICRHGLALWDAAACCEREGSLDSNMRDIIYSDFDSLYEKCPRIHTVLCNGGTAHSAVFSLHTPRKMSHQMLMETIEKTEGVTTVEEL